MIEYDKSIRKVGKHEIPAEWVMEAIQERAREIIREHIKDICRHVGDCQAFVLFVDYFLRLGYGWKTWDKVLDWMEDKDGKIAEDLVRVFYEEAFFPVFVPQAWIVPDERKNWDAIVRYNGGR